MFNVSRHCSRGVFALMLVACGADASAQVTDCEAFGRQITCSTRNSGGAAKGMSDFISGINDRAVRKRVGELLANGNCEEAGRYAFSKGRLELGEQVMQSCQSYSIPAPRPARPALLQPTRPISQPSARDQSITNPAEVTIEAFHRGEYAGQPERIAVLAKQGFAPAQNALGMLYQQGQGVPQSNAEAVRLYRLAAGQGMRDAQANLAWMYENGQGVPKNIATAKRYYSLAADQGDRVASLRLNALMTGR